MLDFNKYHNKLPYPARPAKPFLPQDASPAAIRAYADDVERWEKELVVERAAMVSRRAEGKRLFDMFKADALAENGLTGHPKAEVLFGLACAAAHEAEDENAEIANWVGKLAELLLK